jgi:phosphoglucosamine mutase
MPRLFGTDGIRLIANSELTGDLAHGIGRAAIVALNESRGRRPRIAVGRDTRASGEFLEAALVSGICSAGGDALLLGVVTTPGVAFLTRDLEATAGIVISASHNPVEYNGIKIFGANGYKLPDEVEDDIERTLSADDGPRPTGRGIGRIRPAADAHRRYLDHLAGAADGTLDGMRLVVDCANGSASADAPALFRRLGADVVELNAEPDGWNINEGGGATQPEAMAATVVAASADAGVAFDGDADRAIFADAEGNVIDGDQVLAACAVAMHEDGALPGDQVVATVMSNLGLRRCLHEAGVAMLETRVGDRYVLEEMLRSGAALGGEQSGHVIFMAHATTGDGLLTGVHFLTLATRRGVPVSKLAATMRRYPQALVNVEVRDREALDGADEVWAAVRGAEGAMGERGRVLVRASGTEPLVRVMVEAPTQEEADGYAESIAGSVRVALGA